MIYDDHNDHTCTLRLRLWEAEEPEMDQECVLQERVEGGWLECGLFDDVAAALNEGERILSLAGR